jgi:glutaredoxin 3
VPKVRLFTTPSCPYCYTLREFLKEHDVKFEDIDVSKDAKAREEMIQKSKQMSTPIVEVDGEIVVGFDRGKICQLLNIED